MCKTPMKTQFNSFVILFQQTFQYWHAISKFAMKGNKLCIYPSKFYGLDLGYC